ncbi:hypothetical protein DH2020_016357 [Rehmannia glutinosa]|uniref:LETM1-like protein n=1 Tax=Rehmannia glutinosa TaxID=99300 RepID=A0ABR0WMS3_REHGL
MKRLSNPPRASKININEQERHRLAKNVIPKKFLVTRASTSHISPSKWIPPGALSSMASDVDVFDDGCALAKSQCKEKEFNRVNCLVWVLHESSRSFSLAIRTLELARTGPPVAMAWNGVDVHAWHKHIAYQVAAYGMLKAAIEVELLLSHNRCNNPSPVYKILAPNTNFLRDHIESQLNTRNPKLVQWFQMVELPRLAGLIMPLFKKWSLEYAGSGVAGTIMAITLCAALGKLGSGRISCPLFSNLIEEALIELMIMAHDLVSVDKLHHLANEAGFEEQFLSHFGSKVLPSTNVEDIEFWIGLVQRKLSVAFERESVIKGRHDLSNKGLLSTCLEDHWAAYDRAGDLPKIGERNGPDSAPSFLIKSANNSTLIMDALQRPDELKNREKQRLASPQTQIETICKCNYNVLTVSQISSDAQAETSADVNHTGASKSIQQSFFKKSAMKLVAATVVSDVWMGTQLLFVDISDTLRFLAKKLCGDKVTKRERKKMQKTLADIATLIPVTILMLLPIPSPYSDERLNLVKQLKRTKKMEVQRINTEDTVSKVV